MPSQVFHSIAPGDDPVFVPLQKCIAVVSATSWTNLALQLSQSADTTDSNGWVSVGSSLTANGIVTLNGGMSLKAVKTGAGAGTITVRIIKTA